SLGGGMTHVIACKAADVFAAAAPAAADLTKENVADCKPSRPITVIAFRGTADSNVSYAGGSVSPNASMPLTGLGAKASFQKWAEIDGCTDSASAEDANGCARYAACQGGAEVLLCTKQGGGHEPGDASVGWPVLKRHSLP
ncbi:MAG: feruloyl esterase, partial [Polyangiaceae bacterium]